MSLDFKQLCVFLGKSGTFVVSKVMSPMRFQRSSFLHLLFGMHLSLSLPVQSVHSVSTLPTEVSGSIGEIPAVKRCFVMFIQCYCIHRIHIQSHIYIYVYNIHYYSLSFPCTTEAKCREASTGIGIHVHLFALQFWKNRAGACHVPIRVRLAQRWRCSERWPLWLDADQQCWQPICHGITMAFMAFLLREPSTNSEMHTRWGVSMREGSRRQPVNGYNCLPIFIASSWYVCARKMILVSVSVP